MLERLLSHDVFACAEYLRMIAEKGQALPPAASTFVAKSLFELSGLVRSLENDLRSTQNHLMAADARIEALTIPDYLAQTQRNTAILEGRIAGVVVDLRDVFERERRDQHTGGAA